MPLRRLTVYKQWKKKKKTIPQASLIIMLRDSRPQTMAGAELGWSFLYVCQLYNLQTNENKCPIKLKSHFSFFLSRLSNSRDTLLGNKKTSKTERFLIQIFTVNGKMKNEPWGVVFISNCHWLMPNTIKTPRNTENEV